jgi:hypothetical protein
MRPLSAERTGLSFVEVIISNISHLYVFCIGFEVLTPVVMKSTIFWDMTPCSPLRVNRRFGGTCLICLPPGSCKFRAWLAEDGGEIYRCENLRILQLHSVAWLQTVGKQYSLDYKLDDRVSILDRGRVVTHFQPYRDWFCGPHILVVIVDGPKVEAGRMSVASTFENMSKSLMLWFAVPYSINVMLMGF